MWRIIVGILAILAAIWLGWAAIAEYVGWIGSEEPQSWWIHVAMDVPAVISLLSGVYLILLGIRKEA
ncbi:MAG: hypothetical protein FWF37_03895 [Chloroflexi bacterium]|nr:hypothetical protein [Chloroflexota bacterium]